MTEANSSTHRYPWEHEGETLVLETPEQTTIEHRIAPFSVRCVAAALDYLLVGLWVLLLLMVIGMMSVAAAGQGFTDFLGYAAAAALVSGFVGSTFYFTWAELRGDGRTWGKRRLGIRTLMESGHGVTFGAAIVRNLARVVDNLPLFWILPAFARGGRRIGDLLAGTVVVVDGERRRRMDRREGPAAAAQEVFAFTSAMAAKLAPEDLDLLEYVGEQVAAAPEARRRRLAATIADRYVARLGLEHEQVRVAAEPERFLAELEAFLRGSIEQEF